MSNPNDYDFDEVLKKFKEAWEKDHPNTEQCQCHAPWTCPRCGYPHTQHYPYPPYPYYPPPYGPYYWETWCKSF